MSKKNNQPQIIENVTIADMAAEGKCVARHNEKVIFVEQAAPGDVADLKIFKKKKKFSYAKPVNFHQLSKDRIQPFCEHYGVCGGCKWQHINYPKQLEYKTRQVKDNFERIGKIFTAEIFPAIPSAKDKYYRNKLEYTFSNKRWLTPEEMNSEETLQKNALGFHIAERFDKILDIRNCYLQPEPSNSIRLEVRSYALKNNLSFFDIVEQHGFLRNLIIRTANSGQVMVIVQVFHKDDEKLFGLLDHLVHRFPEITSLQYVINHKGNETFHDLEVHTYSGESYITETMEGLQFRVGPKSFYQTNSDQAYELYKVARDYAGLTGKENVYDLYTGTGTIANFVARNAAKVTGIEFVPMAIEDAKVNSEINGIGNTSFYAGDVKDVLTEELIKREGRPDVIITDPPRAGMHEDVVKKILELAPEKVVYVSCNPATQARDLALLEEIYTVVKAQPVDMFPYTHHVESVALLVRKL
ncbi:MAG: 23S rRNA (uracil(1939)-C(5))-methyltransferase RlmD [Cytophagaceae bacterium]